MFFTWWWGHRIASIFNDAHGIDLVHQHHARSAVNTKPPKYSTASAPSARSSILRKRLSRPMSVGLQRLRMAAWGAGGSEPLARTPPPHGIHNEPVPEHSLPTRYPLRTPPQQGGSPDLPTYTLVVLQRPHGRSSPHLTPPHLPACLRAFPDTGYSVKQQDTG